MQFVFVMTLTILKLPGNLTYSIMARIGTRVIGRNVKMYPKS